LNLFPALFALIHFDIQPIAIFT